MSSDFTPTLRHFSPWTDHPGTPAADGLHMPGEFASHAGCWMAWPCRAEAFGHRLEEARRAYAAVARTIAAFEPVTMLARPDQVDQASAACGPMVMIRPLPLDDSWTRDTGPTFLVDGRGGVAGVDWRFNGWGEVWPGYENDALLARSVLEILEMRRYEADFVLEGGAIHVDGQGTLMAVAPCLLDPLRNPGMNLPEMENRLKAYLDVKEFIWLEHGLENDETAGHIDNVACFARPGVVLVQVCSDPADGNYLGSRDNLDRLSRARDARGQAITVMPIEQPAYREGKDGRLALSYINFYLANGAVIMPAFGQPQDDPARETLARVFPNRRIIQLPVLDIVWGGGGIHCITQQQPAGNPLGPRPA